MVFFLRPFLWGILAFRIVETVCKPFTLFPSKWEPNYDIRVNYISPTPRMTKKLLCCILPHVPWAPLHPTISPSLKRKRICYSFILFKIVCNFSMVTSQKHHYSKKAYISIFIHYCVCCNTYGQWGYMYKVNWKLISCGISGLAEFVSERAEYKILHN